MCRSWPVQVTVTNSPLIPMQKHRKPIANKYFWKVTIMTRTVICQASTEAQAESIVQRLNADGISPGDISVLFPDKTDSREFAREHNTRVPEGSAIGGILISVDAADEVVVNRVKGIFRQAGADDISKDIAGGIDATSEASQWHNNSKGRPDAEDAARSPMNFFFKKLPGFTQSPPGLEREVLRLLPRILLLGTLFLCVPSLLARIYPWDGSQTLVALRITSIDIYMISALTLHWSIAITVALAAFIVMVMKGPAYVADGYPLEDADAPAAAKRAQSARTRNSAGAGY
jgi:hypothetical protein